MKLGDDPTYLTGFIPHGNMSTAHHILLYGCLKPGGDSLWDCGEMHTSSNPVCAEGAQIVYAWAMDAPMLTLPEGVGFKVGGDTDVKYLVLQVHYKDVTQFVPPNNNKDNSGITLIETSTPQPKRAGVYLMGTGGQLPAHATTYLETACTMEEPIEIHPFAFRVHTHTHGEVVSGYRIRGGEWTEIGRNSPKKPQMFYNVTSPGMTVHQGDVLAARCTMVNNEDRTVKIGPTQNDEMCNFYIMYWVDGDNILPSQYCFTDGTSGSGWNKMESIEVNNAPADASMVPGTKKLLKATVAKVEEDMVRMNEEMENIMDKLQGQFSQDFDLKENLLGPLYDEMSRPEDDGDDYAFPRSMRNDLDQRHEYREPISEQELQEYYDQIYGL